MKYRYIPACVMLAAGLVCCIMSIVQRWDVIYSLVALIIVRIVFYLLGQIAAQVIGKVIAEHEEMERLEKERLEREQLEKELEEAEETSAASEAADNSDPTEDL